MSRNPVTAPMERVIEFFHARGAGLDEHDWDQDIIDARILDSLGFVEFLFVMEELTGERIDPDQIHSDNFRSLNRIAEVFFEFEKSAR